MTSALRAFGPPDCQEWTQDVDAIHRWYRMIMGFDWKLAEYIIDKLGVSPGDVVLDPFAGAGTTLVQCKKRGINAIGLDVNPVCTLASTVKTTWSLDTGLLRRCLERIVSRGAAGGPLAATEAAALRYLQKSGMIERGWLSLHKARIVLSIRRAIRELGAPDAYRRFFYLALISAIVSKIADIKFGPEVYCVEPRRRPAMASFIGMAEAMISDMTYARRISGSAQSTVFRGDSRSSGSFMQAAPSGVDFVITSPPYPNEHDYTRSTRLELVILGHVRGLLDLRRLKHHMVRCTTKGLYKDDSDAERAAGYPYVERIARNLDYRASAYTDGFSQLYGRMVREYFGGMRRHLNALKDVLRPGSRCAYVVRDTRALLGQYIDTPGILAKMATSPEMGYELEGTDEWKKIKGTTGDYYLSEKIIMFRKPRPRRHR